MRGTLIIMPSFPCQSLGTVRTPWNDERILLPVLFIEFGSGKIILDLAYAACSLWRANASTDIIQVKPLFLLLLCPAYLCHLSRVLFMTFSLSSLRWTELLKIWGVWALRIAYKMRMNRHVSFSTAKLSFPVNKWNDFPVYSRTERILAHMFREPKIPT